jgi:hypothetical protein
MSHVFCAQVDQVQIMAVVGNVGGSQADPANAAFSDGFGWINYDVGLSEATVGDSSASGAASRRSAGQGRCELSMGIKLIEKVSVCTFILLCVAGVRICVKWLYVKKYPDDPNPPDLAFPGWEGPGGIPLTTRILLKRRLSPSFCCCGCLSSNLSLR